TWISRRQNYFPLDASPFVSELFAPSHSDHFYVLPESDQERLIQEQKLASDGIDAHMLAEIYQRLYVLEFLTDSGRRWTLKPGFEVESMAKAADHFTLSARCQLTGDLEVFDADIVVLSTGFHYVIPPCLAPIRHRLKTVGGQFVVRRDFSVEWDGPEGVNIYVQNASRHCRGVADPNLSLMAWRNANIINSLVEEAVYDVEDPHTVIDWPGLKLERPLAQAVG
ncbi:MAG: SidA/IucD/PvdA family monooxygenase, partial [Acidobacteria bacterium]|nr:SidA/IucD/PvdA family monooxygenase [Acidobacteriota bacterium]